MTRPGQGPDLPVLLTDGWLLGWFKEETKREELPLGGSPTGCIASRHRHQGEVGICGAGRKRALSLALGVLAYTWEVSGVPGR